MSKLFVLLQYFLPKHILTVLAGKFANKQSGKLTTRAIKWFVRRYRVNMKEAANPDIASYATFNDFFTRALADGARPLAKADFIWPVDGKISQLGAIKEGRIFQAKGRDYSTLELVAGNVPLASHFENGHFSCLYLSPKDYHRIHMPCDGVLKSMTYVPGDLFSVNPATAENIPKLFARNERVVCEFQSEKHGTFAMVLVGATIVGSMATVWHDIINPPRIQETSTWRYDGEVELKQGEEMGRFLLGSTVVLLFEKGVIEYSKNWKAGRLIRLGEAMTDTTIYL
ncbi:MAG: archaetidylserine decarboxylase [Methylophilaceae bacterium]